MIAFYGILCSAVSDAADRADGIRKEIETLESDLKTLQSAQVELGEGHKSLADEVRKMKVDGSTNFWDDFRLKWKLRSLRDILNREVALEKKETETRTSIFLKKKELQQEIRAEADRDLESAKTAYREKRPDDAENLYRDALNLLQEHQALTRSLQEEGSDTDSRQTYTLPFSAMTTGYETPNELRELAKILMSHYDQMGREILELEYRRLEVAQELTLRKNLRRFQGVLDRSSLVKEEGSKDGPTALGIEGQIQRTEDRLSAMDRHLKEWRLIRKELLVKAKKFEMDAGKKEKELRGVTK
ncbi:MAG: hypothetical protein HZA19_00850 [Nitrospirae bacterium]|nr:hypothetical protein [Nitrospirota bacterium]